ncbi:MAG: hypothetical protein PVG69_05960 [Desulfobacterales bacterium]|jgi:predicted DNA-binding protein YlxM (UPF0122 family)
MEIKENLMVINDIALPQPSSGDLRGRQSVRATFKLSAQAIDILSIVSAHLGIKQKSIFDHLMEDDQSLTIIAQEVDPKQVNALERIQKTFVISRKTLLALEEAARQFNTSRDVLVELSIQRLLPIIYREQEKHEKRKKIVNEIKHFLDQGATLLAEFESDLGKDDPVSAEFKRAIDVLRDARTHIGAFVVKGQMIENFNV